MNGHETNGVLRHRHWHTGQIMLIFQDTVYHPDKARETFKARLFILICPQREGIEVGLSLGTISQSPYHVIVETVLVDLPNQIIQRMRLGIGPPALQGLMEMLQLFLQFLSD